MNSNVNPFLLTGKVCIVTGAGKGIGRETAIRFRQAGARLALISRSMEDLISLEKELVLDDACLFWEAGDVSDPEVVDRFVQKTIGRFGYIDVLINNAGMRFRKSFLDISRDDWDNVMKVNLGSVFLFCQAVGRQMVKQRSGRIVNMASIIGTLSLPDLSAYAASKGAIISLTKSLAVEWAQDNINVNVIAPGFCETSYAENFKQKTQLFNMTIDRTPQRRWGKSADIANACLFLASDASSYITGEVLSVDGGWSAW